MASKTKTGLSETTLRKSSPASLRVSRITTKSEPDSPSPTLLLNRSSANSKPSTEKKSPRLLTASEKTQGRVLKGSEQQPRLIQIKEDLRKANEQIALLENEKAKALDELKQVQKEAEESSMKLDEALKAQKKSEENFEIEKFEAVEAGIEAVQRKEDEMKKVLENVKNQHASDSASLLLVTKELEKVKRELAAANDAKSKALSEADDASKIAVIQAEKVEILSSELIRLKALLDSTREKETISKNEISSKLGEEILVLKREVEKARSFETEVKELEMIIERLKDDLEAAKMAESYAHGSADEWHSKARELEEQSEEANELKRSASVSLVSVKKQLEGSNDRLHSMESEITDLKEYTRLLETTVARQKEDLEESEQRKEIAEEELSKIEKETLKLKKEKNQILKNEQDATSSAIRLLEENNKILSELERSKEEEEKSKKAMESLASALQEVSSEARELKEKLLSQDDQDYETQIEDLKLVNKATNEKYEKMLEEARHEIDVLVSAVEQTKKQFESSMVDWETREAGLVNHVKIFDEEVSSMGKEMNRLGNLVKRTKEEADAAWKKESEMRETLKEVEDEVIYLQETLRDSKCESLKLKEKMLDKETEFQSVVHENDELRVKHDDSVKKIKELSKLLEEALAKKENIELSEGDYDLLPKIVEFSEENGQSGMNKKLEEDIDKKEDSPEDDAVEVEHIMLESYQIEKKQALHKKKPEQESPKEENMADKSEKTSPKNMEETINKLTGEDQLVKKKKKTLLGKVGNLLKNKGSVNQK